MLAKIERSMKANAVRDLTFVICIGPMGVGKTRAGSELVKAAKEAVPGWKCGYVKFASDLPGYNDESFLKNNRACDHVLACTLMVAFLGRASVGTYVFDLDKVRDKLGEDLGNHILLHIDEFSENPLAVRMLMRACVNMSLETKKDKIFKVIPVITGVQSLANMMALPRGSRYGVEYYSLAPLTGDDALKRLNLSFIKRIGITESEILEKCIPLQNLMTDCGGFPASLESLADQVLALRTDHLSVLQQKGHLDVGEAKDLYNNLLEAISDRYSESRWANIFLKNGDEQRSKISLPTKTILRRVLLDVITGADIVPSNVISLQHDPEITYKLVETGGLVSLKEKPQPKEETSAEKYQVFMPMLAVSCMNNILGVIEGDVLKNPFEYGVEIHEQLALISLQARLRRFHAEGVETCTLEQLRPGALFAGNYEKLVIEVPASCKLYQVGRLFEGPLDLRTGLEGKGPLPREPGTLMMAVGQRQWTARCYYEESSTARNV